MRRRLILSGRANGHPFRNHVRQVRLAVRQREDDSDLKLFAVSFTAFFICFYTFLL
ncbi:hypothetical protein [Sphingomonas turrisvirgatae]|uniref:hypothetical protein n=1 Tax=Sphingomonas turrisvirgatae TaxID=1888892 RepID=UPI00156AA404|nr:hypothetical protein [Sphingomonas turrisvirgatae]